MHICGNANELADCIANPSYIFEFACVYKHDLLVGWLVVETEVMRFA